MRVLVTDIETSPILAYTWGLRNQFISIDQIVEPTRMLCFAAKWVGEKKTVFYSEFHHSREEMVEAAWKLIDEADVVVGYNHKSFDMRHFTREFMEAGMPPPSPVKLVDLYREARQAYFPSHKLQYVSTAVGLEGKLSHTGFKLWTQCLAGDPKAWNLFKRYNVQDVKVTEELYHKLLPYLKTLPISSLYADDESGAANCPKCGG
ncbi:ribonuclease H-like domain-containing protein, partial [Nocardioides massiliensis]